MPLPIADTRFKATRIDADTTLIIAPHTHVLEQANLWLVQGRDRDMILDTGMGIRPRKPGPANQAPPAWPRQPGPANLAPSTWPRKPGPANLA